MRKTIKRIAVLFLALMLVFTLVACSGGGLSGTYLADDGTKVTFSGNNITMSVSGIDVHGTYSISGDEITITLSVLGVETSQSSSFSQSGNTITLDGQKFVKQ